LVDFKNSQKVVAPKVGRRGGKGVLGK